MADSLSAEASSAENDRALLILLRPGQLLPFDRVAAIANADGTHGDAYPWCAGCGTCFSTALTSTCVRSPWSGGGGHRSALRSGLRQSRPGAVGSHAPRLLPRACAVRLVCSASARRAPLAPRTAVPCDRRAIVSPGREGPRAIGLRIVRSARIGRFLHEKALGRHVVRGATELGESCTVALRLRSGDGIEPSKRRATPPCRF